MLLLLESVKHVKKVFTNSDTNLINFQLKDLTLYRIVMPPGTTLLNFKNGYFFSEISLSNIHILKLEDMIVPNLSH